MIRRTKRKGDEKSYAVRYRDAHGLVQLNCSIHRSVKDQLDAHLNESGQTTADFIEESVKQIVSKGEGNE